MADDFGGRRALDGPYTKGFTITPGNAELAQIPRCVFVTGAGNLVMQLADDAPTQTITLPVVANQWVFVRPRRVLATTTATGLIGFA